MYRWYEPNGRLRPAQLIELTDDLFSLGLLSERDAPFEAGRWTLPAAAEWVDVDLDGGPIPARILAVATTLFSMNGYRATTTRQIADAAGLSKQALHYYIKSKEEILSHIVDRVNVEGLRMLDEVVSQKGTATETLVRMILAHASLIARHQNELAVFTEEHKHLSPERRAIVFEHRDKYRGTWERIVRRGQRSSEFRRINARITVQIIMDTLNGMYRWYRSTGPQTAEEVGQSLADLVMRGLEAERLKV
jgi:AcrR family transcriptional regulator